MAAVLDTSPRVVMKATALVKRYGQVVALDGSDFELRSGEDMTTWARSARRPRGAQARSLRSGRAYAGLGGRITGSPQ